MLIWLALLEDSLQEGDATFAEEVLAEMDLELALSVCDGELTEEAEVAVQDVQVWAELGAIPAELKAWALGMLECASGNAQAPRYALLRAVALAP